MLPWLELEERFRRLEARAPTLCVRWDRDHGTDPPHVEGSSYHSFAWANPSEDERDFHALAEMAGRRLISTTRAPGSQAGLTDAEVWYVELFRRDAERGDEWSETRLGFLPYSVPGTVVHAAGASARRCLELAQLSHDAPAPTGEPSPSDDAPPLNASQEAVLRLLVNADRRMTTMQIADSNAGGVGKEGVTSALRWLAARGYVERFSKGTKGNAATQKGKAWVRNHPLPTRTNRG